MHAQTLKLEGQNLSTLHHGQQLTSLSFPQLGLAPLGDLNFPLIRPRLTVRTHPARFSVKASLQMQTDEIARR